MVGVWGDVQELLEANMATFKGYAEAVDIAHLEAVRKQDRAAYMAGTSPKEARASMRPGEPMPAEEAPRGFGKNGKKKLKNKRRGRSGPREV